MDAFLAAVLCFLLFAAVQGSSDHHSLKVSVPHRVFECPEGSDVTLTCLPSGSKAFPEDRFRTAWLYTSHSQEHCRRGMHPRGTQSTNQTLGVQYTNREKSFSVSLKNVKHRDQGKYCCWLLEYHGKHDEQNAHDVVFLTVTSTHAYNGSLKCSEHNHTTSDDSVAEGLAIAACVAFTLCLPLMLMLVYRQRQTVERHRRAHELVRMDSEAQAHDNPVFLGDSPQPKTLTVSQIMRQSSETGHHLLSEPGTPLSPNIQGEAFFPTQDPIAECPNLLE
ncbi:hypothetical protein DNTS_008305 [Danionella cerebrum]|uniref:Ig-like domain-containing protein n=1 Tax=Danionella cerebrum TaxID=2873325 RepID=A0A553QA13_9TELE|nr:hypothetical protein DNTS_008305 [Danionella translucida]TRY86769.1 hypothetical protein DNTS_008305 [Danionella translucida]